ncbi:hypothetical protein JCM10213_002802 [Rhodosporidiobolus nylandii]
MLPSPAKLDKRRKERARGWEGQADQTLPGVDRLSLLPDELLDLVFSFAFDFDVLEPEAPLCTHLPLSKRLYRVQRDVLCREVRLDSYLRFTSSAATVRASAAFLLTIRTFVVSIPWAREPGDLPTLEKAQPSSVTSMAVQAVLQSLSNLRKLSVYGSIALSFLRCTVKDEPAPTLPIPPFDNLSVFTCQGPFRSSKSLPLPNPGKLSALDLMGDDEGDLEYSNEFFSLLPMFPNLRELRLEGILTASPVLYRSVRQLPLLTLGLGFGVAGVTIEDLISLIAKPRHPTLTRLVLDTAAPDDAFLTAWTAEFSRDGFFDLLKEAFAARLIVGGNTARLLERELDAWEEGESSGSDEEAELEVPEGERGSG